MAYCMTSALVLMDRCMVRLNLIGKTGDTSELYRAVAELEAAGEMIVDTVAKRGCLSCLPTGRIVK